MSEVLDREPIEVDDATSTIVTPHWGVTLRTLFGAALASQTNPIPGSRRDYTVLHKGAPIATIFVRQHDDI